MDDLHQGAVPFLVAQRAYGYLAAAGITVAATLLSSVLQPLFGVLTDRRVMPWLVPVGMMVAGAGIGVAAYHPESARVAKDGHLGMSWVALGGNVGFALGPVLVTPVVQFGGLGATPLLMVPAVIGGAVTVWALLALTVLLVVACVAAQGLEEPDP